MNRYETYKNTDLDWVPEIPEHWSLTRSKFIYKNKSVKNCSDEPLLSVTQKDGVVLRSDSVLNVWNPTEDVSGYKLIEPGDFVISLRSFEGGLELSKVRGIVSPAYTVLEKTRKIDDHYYWWLMKSHQFIIELNKHVTGIRQGKNIGWDDFSNIYLTVPPMEEQKLISRYLDKKTKKIDSLVEKIQKKIELLKEQRTSLINQCVTKGLDRNVEMKYSGVKWIGKIPKHWSIKKLKYVSNQISEKRIPVEGDKKISPENVESNTGRITNFYSDYDTEGQNFKKGDILFNKLRVYLNKVVLCDFDGLSMGEMIVVRPSSIANEYLYRVLNSSGFIHQVNSLSEGVKLPRPSVSGIFDSYIPVPPSDEQLEIYQVVEKNTVQLDKVLEKHNSQINTILEYRQSLISSVVTGKVRVTEDMI